MPQLTRMYCSNCNQSVFNVEIDGVRIPIIHYIVTGQAADTGPPLAINGPGVKLTSFTRQALLPHVQVPRVELCEKCFAEVFGLKLLTADADPMFSVEQALATGDEVRAVVNDPGIDEVNTAAKVMERPLLAIKVGRGAKKAPKLPKVPKPPKNAVPKRVRAAVSKKLQDEIRRASPV